MKLHRSAIACALAVASGGAYSQASDTAKTAVVADTLIQIYGHLDVSIDSATKGIDAGQTNAPFGTTTPDGKVGWQPAISSNLSYVGVRGSRDLGESGLRGIFQFETQIDVSATPGPSVNSASSDPAVKGALASRNSYLGLAGGWGAFKVGKTDTPYKLSTGRLDPFSATVGDYNSIIGNTGGDNRAEFDARLSHSAWYESPAMGGFRVQALWSPGQNRSSDNSGVAAGEPDCTGANTAGGVLSAAGTGACTDGSFGNAYSIAGSWTGGPAYVTLAYEKHSGVNRLGDETNPTPPGAPAGTVGVVDESAMKIGVQYKLPTRTTINAVAERMRRAAPDPSFNERQRNGFWLALTQQLGDKNDVNLGWAHAGKTDGDPIIGPADNEANMYALGFKHHWDRRTNWYAVYARQVNHPAAHFDLGASGHGITTDCHDAVGNCFPGTTLQAISVGMHYNF